MGIGKSAIGTLVRSAAIGVASGYLSQTGAAAVLVNTPSNTLPKPLRSPWVRRLSLASAGGEMIANAHLSFLPRRTAPQPLGGRIAFAAGSAALLASTQGRGLVLPIIAGGVSAAVASKLASDSRAALSRYVPDPLVGWSENALAIALAVAASRG